MPRGYRGTRKPKGWKVGQRIEVVGPPGSRIELGPGETFYLPVKATVIDPVLSFHSLCVGWTVVAKVDGTTRHSHFELDAVVKL